MPLRWRDNQLGAGCANPPARSLALLARDAIAVSIEVAVESRREVVQPRTAGEGRDGVAAAPRPVPRAGLTNPVRILRMHGRAVVPQRGAPTRRTWDES